MFAILGQQATAGGFSIICRFRSNRYRGIESRGPGAIFIDSSPAATQVIRANLKRVELLDKAEVYTTDVFRGLAALSSRNMEFGCIFLDPPYGQDKVLSTLVAVSRIQLIADNALVIAEHHRDETVPEKVDGLARVRIQRYGDTVLSFFHRQE